MLRSSIGPDHSPSLQPITITFRNGKPVAEVIQTPTLSATNVQKAATAEKRKDEIKESLAATAERLRTHGTNGHPERKWDSLSVNQNYLNDYAAGFFGTPANREKAYWDRDAFEDAKATLEGWRSKPWRGQTRYSETGQERWVETSSVDGRWEPVLPSHALDTPRVDVPCPEVSLAMARAVTHKRMNKQVLNEAYEAYAKNPEGELANLEAALFAFAPKEGRRSACNSLLRDVSAADFTADDILSDFAIDLIDRLRKGKYHTHDGRFHHWIAYIWSHWFFPEVQTKAITHAELTQSVCDDEFEDGKEGEKEIFYRVSVEQEMVKRNANKPSGLLNRILMDFDNPETEFGKLRAPLKTMIREMARGHSKPEAAKAAGVSDRQARRLLKEFRELPHAKRLLKATFARARRILAQDDPEPGVVSISAACAEYARDGRSEAVADIFEPLLGVEEAAKLLPVHPKTVQALARAGKIPCARMGKYWRFRASSLDAWVREALQSKPSVTARELQEEAA